MLSRESFSLFSKSGTGLLGVALLVLVVVLVYRHKAVPGTSGRAFFTVDDGKTWFADDATKLPPFEKDGKEAVLAHVYRCADGNKFVNDLERFTPDAKRVLENAALTDPKVHPSMAAIQSAYTGGRVVKRPGEAQWVEADQSRAAGQILAVRCSQGGTNAVPVEP